MEKPRGEKPEEKRALNPERQQKKIREITGAFNEKVKAVEQPLVEGGIDQYQWSQILTMAQKALGLKSFEDNESQEVLEAYLERNFRFPGNGVIEIDSCKVYGNGNRMIQSIDLPEKINIQKLTVSDDPCFVPAFRMRVDSLKVIRNSMDPKTVSDLQVKSLSVVQGDAVQQFPSGYSFDVLELRQGSFPAELKDFSARVLKISRANTLQQISSSVSITDELHLVVAPRLIGIPENMDLKLLFIDSCPQLRLPKDIRVEELHISSRSGVSQEFLTQVDDAEKKGKIKRIIYLDEYNI